MMRGLLPCLLAVATACIGADRSVQPDGFRVQVPWPDLGEPATAVRGGEHDSAVIVALEDYAFVASVPGAIDNGQAWQRYLTSTLGVPPSRIALLSNEHATKENIEAKLDWAAKQAPAGGRVWFVFIGHGAPSRSGDGLLLGMDAQGNVDSLEARSLRHGDVIARLEAGEAQPLLVLDACFSGRTWSDESLCAGCQPVTLAEVPTPERAIVLSAGKSDQVAGPLPGRAQPAFSYLVLGALRGWGDGDGNGTITANEVITYANGAMGALVHGRSQTAEVLGDGTFVLAQSAGERGPDLAEIQRILSEGGTVAFGEGIVLPELPNPGDLSNIDISLETQFASKARAAEAYRQKVEHARTSGEDDPTGAKQEKAWCALAELPDPNPARDEAKKACTKVRTYIEQRNRLIAAMRRDWNDAVAPFMSLEHRSRAEKLEVLEAFLEAYEVLEEQGEVRSALAARKQLGRGKDPMATGQPIFIAGGSFDGHDIRDFYLDKTEVTVGAYLNCVDAKHCPWPDPVFDMGCNTRAEKRHPMNCVTAEQAETYCAWVGGRLPSEWEWEWAARNRDTGWPSNDEGCWKLDYEHGTCRVGRYATDVSNDGVLDLVGNVSEWTSSREETERVARGRNFRDSGRWPNWRNLYPSDYQYDDLGFRCARDK